MDSNDVTINGRHLSGDTLTRLCALVANAATTGDRNTAIHELARYIGVGAATTAVRTPDSGLRRERTYGLITEHPVSVPNCPDHPLLALDSSEDYDAHAYEGSLVYISETDDSDGVRG